MSESPDHEPPASPLARARANATQKHQYNSEKTRQEFSDLVSERCGGKLPYPGQLDTAEALLLGLDAVVVAGTGAGKTLPFVISLFQNKEKMSLILSPLKALQQDQQQRFRKMGVAAIAVNGETWSPKLKMDIRRHCYQAILIGPEMCLEHTGFRELLKSTEFTENILAVVVDEAHCISQWGGDFRTTYSKLGDIRSFMPPNVPILATSAMLAPVALKEIYNKLHIDPTRSYFLNLGNDRPNISPSVYSMKNSRDYAALLGFLADGVASPDDLKKTIIFTNSIQHTHDIHRFLQSRLPDSCRSCIDIFHALRSSRSKKRTLKMYRKSTIKILVATEAAGMGADIPDIELVIQFGVPSSLEVWTQRGMEGVKGLCRQATKLEIDSK